MLWGSLDRRGVWATMDTGICVAESFCCSPETITPLLLAVGRYKIKKVKKKRRKNHWSFMTESQRSTPSAYPAVLPETSPLLPPGLRRSGAWSRAWLPSPDGPHVAHAASAHPAQWGRPASTGSGTAAAAVSDPRLGGGLWGPRGSSGPRSGHRKATSWTRGRPTVAALCLWLSGIPALFL